MERERERERERGGGRAAIGAIASSNGIAKSICAGAQAFSIMAIIRRRWYRNLARDIAAIYRD